MNRQIVITASLLGMLAVIAGAFGAHGLKTLVNSDQLEVWHTAVQYQFYHVFALLFLSVYAQRNTGLVKSSFYLFVFGILFFSGSLYLFVLADVIKWHLPAIIGVITPVGGLLFILGWLMLALAAIRNK